MPGRSGTESSAGVGFCGPTGHAFGVDFTQEQLDKARRLLADAGLTHVEFRVGRLEALPLDAASVDGAIPDGVINLFPHKEAVFAEAARQRHQERPAARHQDPTQPRKESIAMYEQQNIDTPHERRPFQNHGHMDVVTLGNFTLGRGVFEPGWRWSNDVKPIAGTESCRTHHTGICLSGQMTVRFDDGREITISPGDVLNLGPGHDAWTLGEEPCILLDTGVAAYAKPAQTQGNA